MQTLELAVGVFLRDFGFPFLDAIEFFQNLVVTDDDFARRVMRLADRIALRRSEMRQIARKDQFPGPVEPDLELLGQRRNRYLL